MHNPQAQTVLDPELNTILSPGRVEVEGFGNPKPKTLNPKP